MKLQDTTAMEALQRQVSGFSDLESEIGKSVVELHRSQAASSQPRSRFLRVDEDQLDDETDRRALAAASHTLMEVYARTKTAAKCDLEELDHVGLIEQTKPTARAALVRWNLHHNLANSIAQIHQSSPGYDHVPVHALRSSFKMAQQHARCRLHADSLALAVFDKAGIPASVYAAAWQSGFPAPVALAESVLRHTLYLIERPGGMDRRDAPELVSLAAELAAVIAPYCIEEFKLADASAASPGPAGSRG